jgi:ferredoxin/coenzyme F420-reducing hydrogenase delta subunit
VTEQTRLKTAVLLCADLETLGHGLDLEAVQEWLPEAMPDVHVQFAPDLGHRLDGIAGAVAADGAARLALGLCSGEYATAELQVQARKAGLDPLGIEVINLGAYAALTHPRPQATERAKILLAAAVARARAFPGSRPENVKPCLAAKVSRRDLFTLSLLEHRSVPSIQGNRCAAGSGCEACVQACPSGALEKANGRVSLDKPGCEGCGMCLTACPRRAIQFPGYAPAQLLAQITTLLDPAVGTLQPRGTLFTCQRSTRVLEGLARRGVSYPAGWLPVRVVCLGMVPPTWLLRCLTLGAAEVGLFPCPGRCRFDQKDVIEGRAAYCQGLLQLLGGSPERVRLFSSAPLPILSVGEEHFFSSAPLLLRSSAPKDAAEMLLRLAESYGAPAPLSLAHPHSPFGVIGVTDGCTGCGVCAITCPTGALALEQEDGGPSLTFDAALCTACGQCLPRCPEAENRVLHLQRITDLQYLSQGRILLHRDRDWRCEACGVPIASEMMLRRIKAILGEGSAPALRVITRYCPDCRVRFGSVGHAALKE